MTSAHSEHLNSNRRLSTPRRAAWEEDEEKPNQNVSQGDLNRNVKEPRKVIDGQKAAARMDSAESAEQVRLEVEENSPHSSKKDASLKDKNGRADVVVVKNGRNMELKDPEALKGEHLCGDDSFCGDWSLFTRVFRSKRFESEKLESLYQRYVFRLNQKFMSWLIILLLVLTVVLIIFQFVVVKSSENESVEGYILCVLLFVYIVLAFLVNRSGSSQEHLKWVSYLLLAVSVGFVLASVICFGSCDIVSTSDGVFITVFFIYTTYTMLPVRMRIAVFGGCLLATVQLICSAAMNKKDPNLWRLVSNHLLLFLYIAQLFLLKYYCRCPSTLDRVVLLLQILFCHDPF